MKNGNLFFKKKIPTNYFLKMDVQFIFEDEENKYWAEMAGVNASFSQYVEAYAENIEKSFLLSADFTDVIRGSYYNVHLANKLKEYFGFRPVPLLTYFEGTLEKIQLYPHQINALTFMKERENMSNVISSGISGGIIRFDMGLGKTLCSIVYSLVSPRNPCPEKWGENGFPTLIVASKTVMTEWKKNGFEKFFKKENVRVLYLHEKYMTAEKIEKIDRKYISSFDFVVTTYDLCVIACKKGNFSDDILIRASGGLSKDKIIQIETRSRRQCDNPYAKGISVLYCTPWERVFLDESQRICNPSSVTYQYIMALYGRYKWCLTGTPVKNSEMDIWAQLRFCGYNGVIKKAEWARNYKNYIITHRLKDAILNVGYEKTNIILPKKLEMVHSLSLTGMEKKCYEFIEGKTKDLFFHMMNGMCNFASILAIFTRLRQSCIAPYLLTFESKRERGTKKDIQNDKKAIHQLLQSLEKTTGEWINNPDGQAGIYSSKMTQIIHVLSSIDPNDKIIVFSSFTSVLDLLARACEKRLNSFYFLQMDGDTSFPEREIILKQFRETEKYRALFMTYKVGSEGLNIVQANHVICIEPWWSPSVQKQAISRCYRTGQEKNVYVHSIYINNSIEERILQVCKTKEELSDDILEGTDQHREPLDIQTVNLDKVTLGKLLGL
jgi:SNF2 family DNA or RNA helicase